MISVNEKKKKSISYQAQMASKSPSIGDSIQTMPEVTEMYPKEHNASNSSSAPSIELRETIPEKAADHVHDPGLAAWRLFVIIGGLCLGLFMALMDLSIISTALYTISKDFHNYGLTTWAALSYILADIGCAVFFTRLSDVFGRRQMVLVSFFFFTVFSLACGLSRSVEQLIVFRALQGIGGTGLYSLCMVICPEISPPKFLPIVVSVLGFTVATAGVCGPVLGGVITGTTTWRWIFWINVPIGSAAIIILFFAWPSNKNITDVAETPSFKQMDFLGAILNATFSILFVFCLQEVGTRKFGWGSPGASSLFCAAGVAAFIFYLWQWYISHGAISQWILPQLPFRILTHRPMLVAILTTILTGYVQFTAVFSVPLRSQIVDLKSPVASGVRLLPLVSATAVGSLFGGGASAKRNLTFYTMSIGAALMLVGTALLSYSLPADGSHSNAMYGYQAILGLGLGMSVSTATFMNSLEVEFIDHAVSQGTVAQSRIFGGAIGIAVSTIIMNNQLQSSLSDVVSPATLAELFISPFTISNYSLETEILFRESYIKAFSEDLRVAMYVAIAAFVVSLCAWQKHPPTVKERSELLAKAVEEYRNGLREGEVGGPDDARGVQFATRVG